MGFSLIVQVASLSKSSEEKEDASIETSEQKMPEPKPDDVTAKQGNCSFSLSMFFAF